MRVLILPFVIILSCFSVCSFSQGTACTNAVNITGCQAATTSAASLTGAPLLNAPFGCGTGGATRRIAWFQYTVGAGVSPFISFSNTTNNQMEIAVYTACPVGAISTAYSTCFAAGSGTWNPGAIPAGTYYLRVWVNTAAAGTATTINACDVTTIPLNGTCVDYPNSATTGLPVLGCGAPNMQRRVTWFKFTAGTTCPIFNFSSGTAFMEVALYDAAGALQTAGSSCLSTGAGVWSPPSGPLVAGNTYYLRVWSNVTAAANINICAPLTDPVQTVTLNAPCQNFTSTPTAPSATTGNSLTCGYANGNVDRTVTWIRFHPTSATACVNFVISNNSAVKNVNMELNLYSGSCPGTVDPLKSMCMADGQGVWSPGPGYVWPNYSASAYYYIRIFTATPFTTPGAKTITVCGTETSPSNDDCANALPIDEVNQGDNNVCAHGGASEIINPNPGWICAGVLHNTAWYKFKIENGTLPTTVNLNSIDCDLFSAIGDDGPGAGQIQVGLMTGGCTAATIKRESTTPASGPINCWQGNTTTHDFIVPGGRYPNGTTIYLAVDGYNGSNCKYGLHVVDNAIPIPVKLKNFLVAKEVKNNLVAWTTSTELNNAYFEIERSADGVVYSPIGKVKGAGNSTSDKHYMFEDISPLLLGYYRLKQVDMDGKPEYSNIVKVRRSSVEGTFNLTMANPVRGNAVMNILSPTNETITLQVVDVAGRNFSTQVVNPVAGGNTITKDFSRLPAGNYYLVATQGASRVIKLFMKQ